MITVTVVPVSPWDIQNSLCPPDKVSDYCINI